jgi:hypothetical protein
MKRHTGNDPVRKCRWTLYQGKNAIDIGHTAAYNNYCSAPPCIYLIDKQGDDDCQSKIEKNMLNEHL